MTTIELTNEQSQALVAEGGKPLNLVDPATMQRYVLIAQEQYERVQELLEQESPADLDARAWDKLCRPRCCDLRRPIAANCRSCSSCKSKKPPMGRLPWG